MHWEQWHVIVLKNNLKSKCNLFVCLLFLVIFWWSKCYYNTYLVNDTIGLILMWIFKSTNQYLFDSHWLSHSHTGWFFREVFALRLRALERFRNWCELVQRCFSLLLCIRHLCVCSCLLLLHHPLLGLHELCGWRGQKVGDLFLPVHNKSETLKYTKVSAVPHLDILLCNGFSTLSNVCDCLSYLVTCASPSTLRERIWMTISLLVSGVFLFFLLVTGCTLKVGRDKFCESVVSTVTNISRWE